MKKLNKVVMSLSAFALAVGGAYATSGLSSIMRAAADEENVVSATWHLGEKVFSDVAADVSNPDVISSSNLSFEGGITSNRVRTAKPASGEIKLTTWNASVSATPVESDFIKFSITTKDSFTPTSLTLNAAAIKTGNARMDIVAQVGDASYTIVEKAIPARTNESDTDDAEIDYSLSYDITDIPAVKGELALKFYLYGDAGKAREVGLSEVCLSGTYTADSGEIADDDTYYFHIPGMLGSVPDTQDEENYIWEGNMGVEGADGDKNFCNAFEGSALTFKNVHVHQAGTYKAVVPLDWATGNGAMLKIEVMDAETGALEASCNTVAPTNSYKWQPFDFPLEGKISEGVKNIRFSFTPGEGRAWAFNFKAPEFVCLDGGSTVEPENPSEVPEGWMTIPGIIDIDHPCWVYNGLRIEGGGANIGYAQNGCSATGEVYVLEAGVYSMNINFNWFQNAGEFQIEIIDKATNKKEVDTYYHIPGIHVADILLEGYLTPGKKTIKYTFHSQASGYIANYIDHTITKVGDSFACLRDVSIEGLEPIEYEGYDYTFNIPMEYAEPNLKVKAEFMGASLMATVGDQQLPVSEDGIIEVPTPAAGESSELILNLIADEGTASAQTEFKVRLYHIGGIVLTGLTFDGMTADDDCIASFNAEKNGVVVDGYVFTSLPEVIATFVDGSSVKATGAMTADHTAAYSFVGKAGSLEQEFSFSLSDIYLYEPSENDEKYVLKYDSGYNGADGIWNNGLYSINANDGWTGTQFKMKNNVPIVVTPPSDIKVKQFVMAALYDNYTPGRVASITSEGATLRVPSARDFKTGVDNDHALYLVVNAENHVPGTPFEITFEGGGQPVAWFEFVYEIVVPTTAPELVKTTATSVEDRNHAVVTFQFNRAMTETTITVNGTEVKAEGGSTSLNFPLWDLPYNADVEVTIPAGAATDTYGNATDKDITHVLKVGSPAVAAPIAADRFTVVSNVEELRAAVAAVKTTNSKRDDLQSIIFLKDGDYDLGGTALEITKVYNVSIIGESQAGVLIHGVQTGISYPVVSTRSSANIFMENLTIRNDLDFGKPERVGVGVAHYGGELDIFKNVTLQSIQDTEVSGERGYWYNVTIHGNVDYICGGGDHFFDHCTLQHEIGGGYIVAPATSTANKYGYVFQHCTIDGVGPYDLGRPWQNEPRAFFLNTTMKALPSAGGWGRMSDIPTYFFEYNSMDAEGNPLDLSTRVNSPSSTNTYSPILPEEYAGHFTVRNVLGGLNSWDAAALVAECEAPEAKNGDDGSIVWNAVDGASGYIVYYDGKFAGYTAETSLIPDASDDVQLYSVAAINPNGCRGKIAYLSTTGISSLDSDSAHAEYYNLQGVRVSSDAKGVVIKVTRNAYGTAKREKIVRK